MFPHLGLFTYSLWLNKGAGEDLKVLHIPCEECTPLICNLSTELGTGSFRSRDLYREHAPCFTSHMAELKIPHSSPTPFY